jgi:hypothetical protein
MSESNQLPELQELPSSPDAASNSPAESATATTTVIASGIALNAFEAPDSQGVALLSLPAEGVGSYTGHYSETPKISWVCFGARERFNKKER